MTRSLWWGVEECCMDARPHENDHRIRRTTNTVSVCSFTEPILRYPNCHGCGDGWLELAVGAACSLVLDPAHHTLMHCPSGYLAHRNRSICVGIVSIKMPTLQTISCGVPLFVLFRPGHQFASCFTPPPKCPHPLDSPRSLPIANPPTIPFHNSGPSSSELIIGPVRMN